ncbi:zinc finger protein 653 isoform X2 [Astyanax mexicanus]|uniref:Zinc finger protein 653 n=1 Tax=Astyanax mexicanus TaxID=7994 RepID=A0A8T2L3C3_ASTMX|nr:zinc finger protein 653 isoform X2 [Astyanax mexicanus]
MATQCGGKADSLGSGSSSGSGEQIKAMLRRCRGRPRLSDSDRAQRRLESRKKYDVRRVYLGESHRIWSDLRRRSSLSDAGLAEYLILLNSAYGERYQRRHAAHGHQKNNIPELCKNQKKGKKVAVTSLHSLVSWYQEHCQTCPHEPELRAVEPTLGLSTSVLWQCEAEHSFIQHISWPAGGASESEEEEEEEEEDEATEEPEKNRAAETPTTGVRINTRASRRAVNQTQLTDAAEELESATTQVSEVSHQMSSTALAQLPGAPSSLGNQASWEVGVGPEGEPIMSESGNEASAQDLTIESFPTEEAIDLKTEGRGRGGVKTENYECVVVSASLMENVEEGSDHERRGVEVGGAHTLSEGVVRAPMAVAPVQGELYETQTLQNMVGTCDLPGQRATLEASQLIIITGPSYEALTSEGIQLNVGGGGVEEVTCTVIDGVAYNQLCQSGAVLQSSVPETDNIIDLSEKQQLLEPNDESHNQKDLQRSPNRSSKRSRRGPVIEADGMLKMFHCPYEGCSQVYVAISSFQNHVNLVHRKGRTKVCPHPGCGKKFYLSNHLHRHMIIHSGVRDFICETCGKSFKRKNHLEVHRRTHTGETPLQCEICGYQCRQRASLNWHMKKHTPEAHYNYTCEHCGKRFEKLDSVKFHKLKSHPDKQTT